MLVLMVGITVALIQQEGAQPTIRLVATGMAPNLDLKQGQKWHLFLSHTWASAQDQCAVIKRQLVRMLPGIKIFLDVDDLDDINSQWLGSNPSHKCCAAYSVALMSLRNPVPQTWTNGSPAP